MDYQDQRENQDCQDNEESVGNQAEMVSIFYMIYTLNTNLISDIYINYLNGRAILNFLILNN